MYIFKTDIEAKNFIGDNFIGNLTGNADYANTTSFSDDFVHVSSGVKYKFEENSIYLLKLSVSGGIDVKFTTLYCRDLINADKTIASPISTNATNPSSYNWIIFYITNYTDDNYNYDGSIITANILQYDYSEKTFDIITSGVKVSYDLKKIK